VALQDLLSEQSTATALLNSTVELGEKLYPATAAEGREAIRDQLQELQVTMEQLFDAVGSAERSLQDRLSR